MRKGGLNLSIEQMVIGVVIVILIVALIMVLTHNKDKSIGLIAKLKDVVNT